MIQRQEVIDRYFTKDGSSAQYRYVDQYLVDDHVILGMYKYLSKIVTGQEPISASSKDERAIKKYLTRCYVFYK